MIVDPETGNPIPDYRPDGQPIPGSEIRSSAGTTIPTPGGPEPIPSSVGMARAPQQPGLGLPTPPLEGYAGSPSNLLTPEQEAVAATARRAREAEAAMAGREGEATITERSLATFQPYGPEFPES